MYFNIFTYIYTNIILWNIYITIQDMSLIYTQFIFTVYTKKYILKKGYRHIINYSIKVYIVD